MSRTCTVAPFDFRKRVSYDPEAKRLFHVHARRQLLALAAVLGLAPCAFDLRSNQGGIAVSGEVTLHADRLYVQVSQPATGSDTGICSAVAATGATTISRRSISCTSRPRSPAASSSPVLRSASRAGRSSQSSRTEGPPPRAFFIRQRSSPRSGEEEEIGQRVNPDGERERRPGSSPSPLSEVSSMDDYFTPTVTSRRSRLPTSRRSSGFSSAISSTPNPTARGCIFTPTKVHAT
jgi:hypothetical protein